MSLEDSRKVRAEIKIEYKRFRVRTRFNKITANMIQGKSKTTPELRGKAAQIRSLIPVLLRIWRRRMNPLDTQHRDILTGLTASADIDKIVRAHRGQPSLPPAKAAQLKTACFTYMPSSFGIGAPLPPRYTVVHHHNEAPLGDSHGPCGCVYKSGARWCVERGGHDESCEEARCGIIIRTQCSRSSAGQYAQILSCSWFRLKFPRGSMIAS